jgi:hypothetical protein
VRSATALALADSVEHWPKTISVTLSSLKELYRDKVSACLPHSYLFFEADFI